MTTDFEALLALASDDDQRHLLERAYQFGRNDLYEEIAQGIGHVTPSKSDTCPRCGSHMDDVVQIAVNADGSKTLSAHCDTCGWKGSKKKPAQAKS